MKTRTLLLLSVGVGLMILLAGGVLLLQLANDSAAVQPADVGEAVDLAPYEPGRVVELASELGEWIERVGPQVSLDARTREPVDQPQHAARRLRGAAGGAILHAELAVSRFLVAEDQGVLSEIF